MLDPFISLLRISRAHLYTRRWCVNINVVTNDIYLIYWSLYTFHVVCAPQTAACTIGGADPRSTAKLMENWCLSYISVEHFEKTVSLFIFQYIWNRLWKWLIIYNQMILFCSFHSQHEGTPYCHVPCYSSLYGPGGFGHGGAESHDYTKERDPNSVQLLQ